MTLRFKKFFLYLLIFLEQQLAHKIAFFLVNNFYFFIFYKIYFISFALDCFQWCSCIYLSLSSMLSAKIHPHTQIYVRWWEQEKTDLHLYTTHTHTHCSNNAKYLCNLVIKSLQFFKLFLFWIANVSAKFFVFSKFLILLMKVSTAL